MSELLKDPLYINLEKEYKFLSRARGDGLHDLTCVILDIETTGLEPMLFELTEIGALKVQGKEVQDIFSSLIHPQKDISAEITRLTGIDNEMVKDFPGAGSVLPRFLDFIGPVPLIAHNADFDLPFIKYHVKKKLQREISNPIICTLKLSRYLLPNLKNHKLHTVAQYFDIPVQNRHRAMGDVEITFQVWQKFIPLLKEKGIGNKGELDSLLARL